MWRCTVPTHSSTELRARCRAKGKCPAASTSSRISRMPSIGTMPRPRRGRKGVRQKKGTSGRAPIWERSRPICIRCSRPCLPIPWPWICLESRLSRIPSRTISLPLPESLPFSKISCVSCIKCSWRTSTPKHPTRSSKSTSISSSNTWNPWKKRTEIVPSSPCERTNPSSCRWERTAIICWERRSARPLRMLPIPTSCTLGPSSRIVLGLM
mmetsp:Transcript_34614/g.58742  ORF Transcript_34614/g.58742 Transcript_34614/m.58742 type:complete len:211 (+) Transcript_34614:203-835(+)